MTMLLSLWNYRKLIGAGALAVVAFFVWRHYIELVEANEAKDKRISQLTTQIDTAVNANDNLRTEVERLNEERGREIKIVEIAAITRTERIETSRDITKDLPNEEPMCGPWGQYFSNVVQYTTGADHQDGGRDAEGVLQSP